MVSGAAGGVGSVAGQIAEDHGRPGDRYRRPPEKCRWRMGFDDCIDYRAEDVSRPGRTCPNGIDMWYFDNVGWQPSTRSLARINDHARIVCVGRSRSTTRTPAPDPLT